LHSPPTHRMTSRLAHKMGCKMATHRMVSRLAHKIGCKMAIWQEAYGRQNKPRRRPRRQNQRLFNPILDEKP